MNAVANAPVPVMSPAAGVNVIEGATVYPEPGFVIIRPTTRPPLITAFAVAVVPPVGAGVKVTSGAAV